MTGASFPLIILNVFLTAVGQVMLKAGMMAPPVQSAIGRGAWAPATMAIATQPMVIGGLAAYGMAVLIWLIVLARVPLSTAYPFVALSIALTGIFGRILFHDAFSAAKLAGTVLIMAGVVLLSRG
jgi:multidrug transporter EmrE-like cation transporter